MASQTCYEVGDRVSWRSGQGTSQGEVKEILRDPKTVNGISIDASEEDPRYLVKNDSTGNVTGHTAKALSKASGDSCHSAFEKGDKVQWNSAQGKVKGEVKGKLTSKTQIDGYTAKASKDDPQYLVESDNTGSQAAHKPGALEPI